MPAKLAKTFQDWLDRSVGRRQVLKGMGATGAGLLAGRAAAFYEPAADASYYGARTSLTASHWGFYHATVERGRLTRVDPWQEEQYPSPMVQGMPDLLYSPTRIRYPMVRKGFLENGENSDTSGRGKEPFVRVSWDEALDLVAGHLRRVKEQYGNTAIYGHSYGWSSAGRLHNPPGALSRLLSLYGGYVYSVNTYSAPVLPVITPHVLGSSRPLASAWPSLIDNSQLFVFFGYNPMINSDIHFGGEGNNYNFHWLDELRKKGTPVVSINPLNEDTDTYLGTERIAIRPNTDTALMLALAHVLYEEGLHDQEYLDRYAVGFDRFVEYLTGASDGQPKTPEWAAPITDVPAETIRDLARRMAQGPTALMGGFSLQRAEHGAQPVWMMVVLSAMLGQIGTPGGGVNCGFPPGMGVPTGQAPSVPGAPGVANPVSDFTPINMWVDMLLRPGETIDYDGQRLTYPDIKMVMWNGGNPFHHAQDTNRVLEAWRRPEVTVVADYNWTASAKHADIVLPATTTLERNDISATSHYIIAMKQAVEPLFEARNDRDICAGIAAKLGFEEEYTEGKSEMDLLRQMYAVAQEQGTARGLDVPDFDNFWEREYLAFDDAPGASESIAYADFIADPVMSPLGTPSGRIEIFSEEIDSFGYDDCLGHPAWLEPSEWLGSDKASTYPLHVLTRHPKYRLHSQLNNTFLRNWYQVHDREPMFIHPDDAAARGIADGDVVRAFNDRGAVLAGAVVTDRTRPGVIVIPQGSWYDPLEPGTVGSLCRHGNCNMLTTDKGSSKLAQGNPSNTTLADVEKYTGELPAIKAFDPPQ
jgi:trimethylamine-N-oxide reductase (cytochrome c)